MLDWLLDTVLDALKEHVEPWIHPLEGNADFWYFLFLLLALVLVFAVYERELIIRLCSGEKYKEHDKGLFKQLIEVINEADVRDYLRCTANEYMHSPILRNEILQFYRVGIRAESRFLNPKIQKRSQSFLMNS